MGAKSPRRPVELPTTRGNAPWDVAVIALAGATVPASATESAPDAIYTWLDRSVRPDGTAYSDSGTGAIHYSRTGVEARIDKADGYTWETRVWFGQYTMSGQATAKIEGPRSFISTRASFNFRPGSGPNDRARVIAWLLDARPAASERDITSESVSNADTAPATSAPDSSVPDYGSLLGGLDGVSFFASESSTGERTLTAVKGPYVASTSTSADSFAEHGLSLYFGGPNVSVQAALSPRTRSPKPAPPQRDSTTCRTRSPFGQVRRSVANSSLTALKARVGS
jgi:hypothetical protein